MGLEWLVFLNQASILISMQFGEDQRANTIKFTCLKEIGLCLQILIITLHSTATTIARTYVSSYVSSLQINKHAPR